MRSKVYHILMSFSLALMLTTSFMVFTQEGHALSPNATIRLCEKNFIGANYKPHLESKCSLIWQKLTYEIMSSFPNE